MTRRILHIILLVLMAVLSTAAQVRPEWTDLQRNAVGPGYYYGVGISPASFDESDTRAFIEFARNVEVKVKSTFQREVSEQEKEFSDATTISMQLVSDMSLKGVAITERFVDTTQQIFYSLIRYRTFEYDSLIQSEIEREVALMKVRNRMEVEKRQEELRMQQSLNQLAEERKKEELRAKREEMSLEEQEASLKRKVFGEFLDTAPPEKIVTLRNGELSTGESSLLLSGGFSPFSLKEAMYAAHTGFMEISGTVQMRGKKIDRQEARVKLQILPGVGEFTRTSLAFGVVQAVPIIADSGYDFKRSRYSLFVAGNVTVPQYYYSTFSFYGDKRLAGLGVTTFPFYEQFKTHVGFMLELKGTFDGQFRNRKGNFFVMNAGIRLQGSETFSTQLAFEDHEEFHLTLEFQF